jgi:hypothetical protein
MPIRVAAGFGGAEVAGDPEIGGPGIEDDVDSGLLLVMALALHHARKTVLDELDLSFFINNSRCLYQYIISNIDFLCFSF